MPFEVKDHLQAIKDAAAAYNDLASAMHGGSAEAKIFYLAQKELKNTTLSFDDALERVKKRLEDRINLESQLRNQMARGEAVSKNVINTLREMAAQEKAAEAEAKRLDAAVASAMKSTSEKFADVGKAAGDLGKTMSTSFSQANSVLSTTISTVGRFSGMALTYDALKGKLLDYNRTLMASAQISEQYGETLNGFEMAYKRVEMSTSYSKVKFAELNLAIKQTYLGIPPTSKAIGELASQMYGRLGYSADAITAKLKDLMAVQNKMPDLLDRITKANEAYARGSKKSGDEQAESILYSMEAMGASQQQIQSAMAAVRPPVQAMRAYGQFDQQMEKSAQTIENSMLQVAQNIQPTLEQIANSMAAFSKAIADTGPGLQNLVAGAMALGAVFEGISTIVNGITGFISGPLEVAGKILPLLVGNKGGAMPKYSVGGQFEGGSYVVKESAARRHRDVLNELGAQWITGGRAGHDSVLGGVSGHLVALTPGEAVLPPQYADIGRQINSGELKGYAQGGEYSKLKYGAIGAAGGFATGAGAGASVGTGIGAIIGTFVGGPGAGTAAGAAIGAAAGSIVGGIGGAIGGMVGGVGYANMMNNRLKEQKEQAEFMLRNQKTLNEILKQENSLIAQSAKMLEDKKEAVDRIMKSSDDEQTKHDKLIKLVASETNEVSKKNVVANMVRQGLLSEQDIVKALGVNAKNRQEVEQVINNVIKESVSLRSSELETTIALTAKLQEQIVELERRNALWEAGAKYMGAVSASASQGLLLTGQMTQTAGLAGTQSREEQYENKRREAAFAAIRAQYSSGNKEYVRERIGPEGEKALERAESLETDLKEVEERKGKALINRNTAEQSKDKVRIFQARKELEDAEQAYDKIKASHNSAMNEAYKSLQAPDSLDVINQVIKGLEKEIAALRSRKAAGDESLETEEKIVKLAERTALLKNKAAEAVSASKDSALAGAEKVDMHNRAEISAAQRSVELARSRAALAETARLGLVGSVKAIREQVKYMEQEIHLIAEKQKIGAQELQQLLETHNVNISVQDAIEKQTELTKKLKEAGVGTHEGQQILAYAEKLCEYQKQINDLTREQYTITQKMREGYLDAMQERMFGAGDYQAMIPTMSNAVTAMLKAGSPATYRYGGIGKTGSGPSQSGRFTEYGPEFVGETPLEKYTNVNRWTQGGMPVEPTGAVVPASQTPGGAMGVEAAFGQFRDGSSDFSRGTETFYNAVGEFKNIVPNMIKLGWKEGYTNEGAKPDITGPSIVGPNTEGRLRFRAFGGMIPSVEPSVVIRKSHAAAASHLPGWTVTGGIPNRDSVYVRGRATGGTIYALMPGEKVVPIRGNYGLAREALRINAYGRADGGVVGLQGGGAHLIPMGPELKKAMADAEKLIEGNKKYQELLGLSKKTSETAQSIKTSKDEFGLLGNSIVKAGRFLGGSYNKMRNLRWDPSQSVAQSVDNKIVNSAALKRIGAKKFGNVAKPIAKVLGRASGPVAVAGELFDFVRDMKDPDRMVKTPGSPSYTGSVFSTGLSLMATWWNPYAMGAIAAMKAITAAKQYIALRKDQEQEQESFNRDNAMYGKTRRDLERIIKAEMAAGTYGGKVVNKKSSEPAGQPENADKLTFEGGQRDLQALKHGITPMVLKNWHLEAEAARKATQEREKAARLEAERNARLERLEAASRARDEADRMTLYKNPYLARERDRIFYKLLKEYQEQKKIYKDENGNIDPKYYGESYIDEKGRMTAGLGALLTSELPELGGRTLLDYARLRGLSHVAMNMIGSDVPYEEDPENKGCYRQIIPGERTGIYTTVNGKLIERGRVEPYEDLYQIRYGPIPEEELSKPTKYVRLADPKERSTNYREVNGVMYEVPRSNPGGGKNLYEDGSTITLPPPPGAPKGAGEPPPDTPKGAGEPPPDTPKGAGGPPPGTPKGAGGPPPGVSTISPEPPILQPSPAATPEAFGGIIGLASGGVVGPLPSIGATSSSGVVELGPMAQEFFQYFKSNPVATGSRPQGPMGD